MVKGIVPTTNSDIGMKGIHLIITTTTIVVS